MNTGNGAAVEERLRLLAEALQKTAKHGYRLTFEKGNIVNCSITVGGEEFAFEGVEDCTKAVSILEEALREKGPQSS